MDRTSSAPRTARGIGLPASTPPNAVLAAAAAAQKASYDSFWLNNPPGSAALPVLARVSRSAPGMMVGVGVIPLSDRPAEEIGREVHEVGLGRNLYLGIGSGSGPGGVERVAAGISALRGEVECVLVVAALGPRMCRLAGREAGAVLLNWLTPEHAQRSIEWVRDAASEAGRPAPRLMAYVRAALGPGARARLEREAGSYEAIPHYAAHFRRMGVGALETAITGDTPAEIQQGLSAWEGLVDEVVVRAVVAEDSPADLEAIVDAARP